MLLFRVQIPAGAPKNCPLSPEAALNGLICPLACGTIPEPSQQHGGDRPLENRIYELRRRVEEQCRALGSIASSIEDRLELMISSIVDSYRTFLSRNHQLKPCTHFMAFKPTVACLPGKIT